MAHYFFSDLPKILRCEGTGTGYKSIVKLRFCAQPMYQIFVIILFCFVFVHVYMLQQLHLPVNSIICKHEKIPSQTFQPI